MPHDPSTQALDGAGYGSMSVAAILAETAHRTPDRTAFFLGDQVVRYGELWDQTRAYAGALRARGIGPGDRVAMIVPNVPDFARVYYGVLALGAVVVPVHLLFKAEEIEFVLRDSGATVLVAAAPMLAEAAPAAARVGIPLLTVLVPDGDGGPVPAPGGRGGGGRARSTCTSRCTRIGPATILYTSGTTGRPKGAVGSHLAIIEQVNVRPDRPVRHACATTSSSAACRCSTRSARCRCMNTAFRRGAAVILLPKFDPDQALAQMVRHGATVFTAVPTMYIGLHPGRRAQHRPARRCGTPSPAVRRCPSPCSRRSTGTSAPRCTRATA